MTHFMLNEEAMTVAVRVVRPLQPDAATVVVVFTNVPYSVNHSGPAREEQHRRDGPSKPRKAAVVTGGKGKRADSEISGGRSITAAT